MTYCKLGYDFDRDIYYLLDGEKYDNHPRRGRDLAYEWDGKKVVRKEPLIHWGTLPPS